MRSFCQLSLGICGFLFAVGVARATDELYHNQGSVTNQVVDAYNFLNTGYFEVKDTTFPYLPYETYNTLNYTNRGTIVAAPGFRFHNFAGQRKPANSFLNEAIISGNDPFSFIGGSQFLSTSSAFMEVDATNIVNRGNMTSSSTGLLRLEGKNIDVRGGGLVASTATASPFTQGFLDWYESTNYFNDSKVSDLYWGVGTNNTFSGNGFFSPNRFDTNTTFWGSGSHQVVTSFGFTNSTTVPSFFFSSNVFTFPGASNYMAFTYSNSFGADRVIQVVFVSTNESFNPAINPEAVEVRFANGVGGRQALVRFGVKDVSVLTGTPMTNYLVFSDHSTAATSGTNTMFYQDNGAVGTMRPNPYDLVLGNVSSWNNAIPSNAPYSYSLLDNPSYTNSANISNFYAGYSAFIGNSVDTNFATYAFSADPTNSLGRVEIIGDKLEMNLARIRSEGLLTVTATNFQALTNGARMDAEQMNLNLTTTNQIFVVSNFLSKSVKRIGGMVNAYSAVWSNQDVNGNNIRFHVLILENQLTSTAASKAYGFTMRANHPNTNGTAIVIEDDVNVERRLLLDAANITIRGDLTVADTMTAANMPRVKNFTNEGFINVPNSAIFTQSNAPYSTFVNRSNIFANNLSVNSIFLQNTGVLYSITGSISLTNSTANSVADLHSGTIASSTDFSLTANEIQTGNPLLPQTISRIFAGYVTTNEGQPSVSFGGMSLAANRFVENGVSNVWQTVNGFKLRKLSGGSWVGDLLGTDLRSTLAIPMVVEHQWAGLDVGAVNQGYTNNAALGILRLDGAFNARFAFSAPVGAGPRAIYVDYLDLQSFATNYTTALEIAGDFRIYFADSSMPAEKLHNTHSGRLQWVKTYAGRYSSTNILSNGQWITVNRALVLSKEIDSDGDGIPNGDDSSPFDGANLVLSNNHQSPFLITWQAAAGTAYTVEYTSDLLEVGTIWTILTNVPPQAVNGPVTVSDPISSPQRIYRVRYTP
jgi:hypothetical protein